MRCYGCKGAHDTVDEVRACCQSGGPPRDVPPPVDPVMAVIATLIRAGLGPQVVYDTATARTGSLAAMRSRS